MDRWFSAVRSVLAGFLGVQSEKKRAEDFSEGRPIHFIVSGLILAGVFVILIMLVVKWAISLANG